MTSRKKPGVAFWATVALVVVLAFGVWRESLDRYEYLNAVSALIRICGVVFAAFCVWLTVRIVNRRERWAKWTLAIAAMLASVASFAWWSQPAPGVLFDDVIDRSPHVIDPNDFQQFQMLDD